MVVPEIESEFDNRIDLPEIIPSEGDVEVIEERKTYITSKRSDGSIDEKLRYTLNKAPITRIDSVTGRNRDKDSVVFSKGVDYVLADRTAERRDSFTFRERTLSYELTVAPDSGSLSITDENQESYQRGQDFIVENPDGAASDTIVWKEDGENPENGNNFVARYKSTFLNSVIEFQQDAENLPLPGRDFLVTYTAPSVISRYIDVSEETFDITEKNIRTAINRKFINTAEGESLDRIGELFGPLIGSREGRNDEDYRDILKSIVQSFVSRGTVSGIKIAVSASTDIPEQDISVREDFKNNSYKIIIQPNKAFTVGIVEEVADIADPSGILNNGTIIDIPKEPTTISDNVIINPKSDIKKTDTTVSKEKIEVSKRNPNTFEWAKKEDGDNWDFFSWAEPQ